MDSIWSRRIGLGSIRSGESGWARFGRGRSPRTRRLLRHLSLPLRGVRSYHGPYRTAQPDSLRHWRLGMTGTEPHALRGAAGRRPYRDREPCAGHAAELHGAAKRHRRPWSRLGRGSRASTHASAYLDTAGRWTLWEPRATSGLEELRDSERTYLSRMRISAPPATGPARGPWAVNGPEELHASEWSHGYRRDAVTVCFQYSAPEVTVMVT